MITHVTLWVKNIKESQKFYESALKPLGYVLLEDSKPKWIGFGMKDQMTDRDFWLKEGEVRGVGVSCFAFSAKNKQQVDEFYKKAIEAGGKDNGSPGYRPKYSENYYAAFVLDPNGYNIEAVWYDPSKTNKLIEDWG